MCSTNNSFILPDSFHDSSTSEFIVFSEANHKNLHILKTLNNFLSPLYFNESFYDRILSGKNYKSFIIHSEFNFIGVACFVIENDRAYILTFGIVPEYRNKNIGSLSLKSIENYLRKLNVKNIMIHIISNDFVAFKFLHKNNFIARDKIKNYYKKLNSDAFLFLKNI